MFVFSLENQENSHKSVLLVTYVDSSDFLLSSSDFLLSLPEGLNAPRFCIFPPWVPETPLFERALCFLALFWNILWRSSLVP